jgi:hypothetical protein
MNSVDRAELNNATVVSYALVMAIFNALDDATKARVKQSVLAFLPPVPNRLNDMPADVQMWDRAMAELKKLGGQSSTT